MSKITNLYGIHTADILLTKYPEAILNIHIQNNIKNNSRINDLINLANKLGLRINQAASKNLENLAGTQNHQGVVVECKTSSVFKSRSEDDLKIFYKNLISEQPDKKVFILVLDEVQDPHNLGACIRSAEAMGVDCIITPQKNTATVNNTVCKVSAGAALLLPVFQVTNLARSMRWLKDNGVWIYGTDMDTKSSLSDLDLKDNIALVMGAEGSGLRKLTKELCDQIFTIPMYGKTQSLNVSVATGMCLYEVTRQRSH